MTAIPGLDNRPLRAVFAIAEAYPFAKVGGLGDIGAALPAALTGLGHDVRLVLPAYPGLVGRAAGQLDIRLGPRTERMRVVDLGTHRGVNVFAVGNRRRFRSAVPYGYSDEDVTPFVLWSKAVTKLAARWVGDGWTPDIVHANDWHAGLIPQLVRHGPDRHMLRHTATALTIHNLAHQGRVRPRMRSLLALPGHGSLLARGIAFADGLNTVSATYRDEILAPGGGCGLDRLLRSRAGDLRAILNGLDVAEFDPWTDPHVACRFNGDIPGAKRGNKLALQRFCGLPPDAETPVVGMVSRLVDQKGIDLLVGAVDALVGRGVQLVVLGSGEPAHHKALKAAVARHPDAVAHLVSTQERVARMVYAGADMLVVPSAHEPCGLTQLIALRYGTVPVVRRTGGLADTVIDCRAQPQTGTGFVFADRSVAALTAAVYDALKLWADRPRWLALQHRGMAADFSWGLRVDQYDALYRTALTRRRTAPTPRRGDARATLPPTATQVPLALVHHANQYLITEGYADREGIGELLDGYAAVLRLHARHGVPASLHLSGTLIQAAAWHRPAFLAEVRELIDAGMVDPVGGTYAENVMPLFPPEFNRRQLELLLSLYERHLGCLPDQVQAAWIPERVWNTESLAPVLTSPKLPNGGYRAVLLDDRLLHAGRERRAFDRGLRADIAAIGHPTDHRSEQWPLDCRMHRVAGTSTLYALPMSTELRYWVPPSNDEHWKLLEEQVGTLNCPSHPDEPPLLIYADDMERTAGVGPWDVQDLDRYAEFLRWVAGRVDLRPVGVSKVLADAARDPESMPEVSLEPGTFLELAGPESAGEDYQGFADDSRWRPLRRHQRRAADAVATAERDGADQRLVTLASNHLLASGYETAWHQEVDGVLRPAPWARAVASHVRACLPLTDAAQWLGRATPAARAYAGAEVIDVDADGEDEVVLRGAGTHAVLSPRRGGRLVHLAVRASSGGALVVGNPTDDWNWQEGLNRFMGTPPNHPGALADVGGEHAVWEVTALWPEISGVELTCVRDKGKLLGARKSVVAGADGLVVRYRLPTVPAVGHLVDCCLSPDYLRLLHEGRDGLRPLAARSWRGWRKGAVAVWVGLDRREGTSWAEPSTAEVGHGLVVRVRAMRPEFSLLIGTGSPTSARCAAALDTAREIPQLTGGIT